MKKPTKQRARAQRISLKQRRERVTKTLLEEWAGAGSKKSRGKLVAHTIDTALTLGAIDDGINPDSITIIFASDAVMQLIASASAIAKSTERSLDDVALELAGELNMQAPQEMPN